MDPGYISAIAALAGSAIGGLTSLAASWLSQNVQARAQQYVQDKARREELYKTFIEEASRLYADALATDKTEVANFVRLYAMVSRMRVLSTPAVIQSAEAIVRVIVDTYFEPNMTFRELHDAIRSDRIDVMRTFSEAARDDLRIAP